MEIMSLGFYLKVIYISCVQGVVRTAMPAMQESVIFDAGKNLIMY